VIVTRRPSAPVELAPSETAGSAVGLNAMSDGRRAVLAAIKQAGEATAEQIAAAVGVTVGATRQHLAGLDADGLVAHREERLGPGRPRRRYCLTPAAEGLWPKRYGQLANQLLGFVQKDSPELVERVFQQRGDDRLGRASGRLAGLDFAARVRELTQILVEDGYLAECEAEADGSWLVVEHNCAILDVAVRYRAACTSEIAFLRAALPEAEIDRVQHKMAGDFVCAYRLRPAAPPTD
jgi:DeoR family transcriptional regulator, suf operon transcriptional repressor